MKVLLIAATLAVSISSIAACQTACPTGLAEGVLVGHEKDLVLRASSGETNTIIWPAGYSVRQASDGLVLTDRFGSVKAREGDKIGVGGGVGPDDLVHACGDVWVVTPRWTRTGAVLDSVP